MKIKNGLTSFSLCIFLMLSVSGNVFSLPNDDAKRMFARGKELYMSGEYTEAINYFKGVLSLDAKNFDALHYMGGALYNIGDYKSAIDYYTRALEIDPGSYYTLYNRGRAKYDNNSINESVEDFTKTLQIKRDFLNALYSRGLAYIDLGQYDKAVDDFLLYLLADIKNYRVWFLKGYALYKKGDKLGARKDFNRAKALAKSPLPDYSDDINPFSVRNKGITEKKEAKNIKDAKDKKEKSM